MKEKTDNSETNKVNDLDSAVDKFFEDVISDPFLMIYFEDSDLSSLKRRFCKYIECLLLDKEQQYDGLDMYNAHTGRGITGEAVDLFIEKFINTLREHNIDSKNVEKVEAKLRVVRFLVIDKFKPSGAYVYKPQRFGN